MHLQVERYERVLDEDTDDLKEVLKASKPMILCKESQMNTYFESITYKFEDIGSWYCMPDDADDELYLSNTERELAEGKPMNIIRIKAKPCEESTRTANDPAC